MKVKAEEREGLFKALTVEVEGEKVKSLLDEVYSNLKQNVEIQGFRRGTAPLWLIKAKYKEYIEEEVGKKVANQTLEEAIKESSLTPVADIYLERVELEEKTPRVTYTVTFETAPEFELKDVEGLEVEVPKLEFKPEIVDKKIEQLREEHAVWEPVEDRPIKEGDLVTIEYEVEEIKEGEEGEKVTGETSGIIGQKMFREELEQALTGKKVGEEVTLKELPIYDQEGKEIGKANIKAKIKDVKEKVLPELDDDFAKELGYENWEEAKKKIEEQVKEEFEKTKQAVIEDAVADKLISIHEMEIPKTLLNRELSFLVERRVNELKQFGIDTRYLDFRSMAQELLPQAQANIKLRYILDKYAQTKGIEVTEEDIEEQFEELARQMGTTKDEVKEYFERENLMDVVKSDATRKKALKELISKVKIKEVEPQKEEVVEEEKEEEKPKKRSSKKKKGGSE
ncbi:trigger factor [Hydrogenivirga caldilitoris]|uniref:Trigger factor n=1 Tax=Hydrogenivirga caldilitoris TaxID=246264 RepID=A0A497XTF3_9AQUI|nr:trigger factor [Hydrogenivirga caldilitoris]RLJ71541.1 trigger factor [Hydrogenivirga caldilitoris]